MKKEKTLAERWLWLGVSALAVAGLYSLVPVVGRTPQLKSLPVVQHFFDVALVVHVDLSVLVWFLAMLGMGCSCVMEKYADQWPVWLKTGWAVTSVAALLMALSPLGAWEPVKSNYVPVLHNSLFLFSLALFTSGILITFIPPAVTFLRARTAIEPAERAWCIAAIIALLSLVGFWLSARSMPQDLTLVEHYEHLFWAGGHVLQFSFVAIVMGSWLALLQAIGAPLPRTRWLSIAYGLTFLGAAATLTSFALHAPDSSDFTMYNTRVMIELGGVGASLMAVLVITKLRKTIISRSNRTYISALIASLVLFFAGGALGLMISGQNVTIPAHYHGMIVGITLALMGLAYAMLPRFGYDSVASARLAFYQPIIYGVGQIMHIGGLAYCGGYGILRKVSGGFENLTQDVKVALGIFGMGGIIAIIGGILFVVVMVKALKRTSVSHQTQLI